MRWFLRSLVVLVTMIGLYVGSAVISLNGLVDATRAGDGAEILARTDLERLKHSLVDQVVSAYLAKIGQANQNRPIKPFERILANTYGASIADALIAKMLTAENIAKILQKGMLSDNGDHQIAPLGAVDTSRIFETLGRFSLVKPVEFFVRLGEDQSAGGISLHFEGNGWKLSGLSLPANAVQELATSLPDAKAGKS